MPEAEARLAYWINNGVGGLARDHVKAEQWAKKALADGLAAKAANSAEAQTELATLYEFGLGAPKDLEKAAELYQKAAHQGNQDAIANLKRLSKPAVAFPPGVGGVRITHRRWCDRRTWRIGCEEDTRNVQREYRQIFAVCRARRL